MRDPQKHDGHIYTLVLRNGKTNPYPTTTPRVFAVSPKDSRRYWQIPYISPILSYLYLSSLHHHKIVHAVITSSHFASQTYTMTVKTIPKPAVPKVRRDMMRFSNSSQFSSSRRAWISFWVDSTGSQRIYSSALSWIASLLKFVMY